MRVWFIGILNTYGYGLVSIYAPLRWVNANYVGDYQRHDSMAMSDSAEFLSLSSATVQYVTRWQFESEQDKVRILERIQGLTWPTKRQSHGKGFGVLRRRIEGSCANRGETFLVFFP